MANHVNRAADVGVPALSVAEFTAQLQHGDILFCSGSEAISHAIEGETKSPWSHVGYILVTPMYPEPLFIEAVYKFGVRISRVIPAYITGYNGDMVLCRRPCISAEGLEHIVAKAISRLGDGYDWESEVEQAAHKLCNFLPEHASANAIYCSGLLWYASTAWSPALQRPSASVMPSPEDNWVDPTITPVCKLIKGTG